jgi:hypothetical protein
MYLLPVWAAGIVMREARIVIPMPSSRLSFALYIVLCIIAQFFQLVNTVFSSFSYENHPSEEG